MSSVIRPSLILRKYEGVTHARRRQDLSTGTNLVDRLFQKWSRVPRDIRDANSVRCLEFLPETLAALSRMLCRRVRESREGKASAPRYPLRVQTQRLAFAPQLPTTGRTFLEDLAAPRWAGWVCWRPPCSIR